MASCCVQHRGPRAQGLPPRPRPAPAPAGGHPAKPTLCDLHRPSHPAAGLQGQQRTRGPEVRAPAALCGVTPGPELALSRKGGVAGCTGPAGTRGHSRAPHAARGCLRCLSLGDSDRLPLLPSLSPNDKDIKKLMVPEQARKQDRWPVGPHSLRPGEESLGRHWACSAVPGLGKLRAASLLPRTVCQLVPGQPYPGTPVVALVPAGA